MRNYYWVNPAHLFNSLQEITEAAKEWEDTTSIMVVSIDAYTSLIHETDRLRDLLEDEIKKNQHLINANSGL